MTSGPTEAWPELSREQALDDITHEYCKPDSYRRLVYKNAVLKADIVELKAEIVYLKSHKDTHDVLSKRFRFREIKLAARNGFLRGELKHSKRFGEHIMRTYAPKDIWKTLLQDKQDAAKTRADKFADYCRR